MLRESLKLVATLMTLLIFGPAELDSELGNDLEPLAAH